MLCTSTTQPAVSLPVSPRKSLLPEKVQPFPGLPPLRAGPVLHVPFLTLSSLSALATLKPQAGLIVPQAVPSSQPSVVVSGPQRRWLPPVCSVSCGAPASVRPPVPLLPSPFLSGCR